jgi:hypothetical protein
MVMGGEVLHEGGERRDVDDVGDAERAQVALGLDDGIQFLPDAPLAFEERFFHPLALGDIPAYTQDPDEEAPAVEHGRLDRLEEGALPVVGEGDPLLVDARPAELYCRAILADEEVGQLLLQEVVVAFADDLVFRRAEEALEGVVAGEIDPFRILEPDQVRDGLEKSPDPGFALADFPIGLEEIEGQLDRGLEDEMP